MSKNKRRPRPAIKKILGLLFTLVLAVFIIAALNIDEIRKKFIYPIKYEEYVEAFAEENNVDKYLIYAIIKTESAFKENAVSEAGARGLMQLMEDAYEWVKFRMKDERNITYDDMYKAERNIEYGSYLIGILYEEYRDAPTALAAYHSGRGTVNEWLKNKSASADGAVLTEIPSASARHYVNKVMTAYDGYTKLYED